MAGKSKRTTAPMPPEFPWATAQPVLPPADQSCQPPTAQSVRPPTPPYVLPPAIPSMFPPGAWLPPRPPQSMAASSPPCWVAGLTQPGDLSTQGPWGIPSAGIGGSAQHAHPAGNIEDKDLQSWGLDSHPPGGFLSFFNNTPGHTQAVRNGTSSQPINAGDDTKLLYVLVHNIPNLRMI